MDAPPGSGRIRNITPELRQVARQLRRKMTPHEWTLWQALSGKQLDGLRFRRQHAVGTFCFDFFCPEHSLVVELDGAIHNHPDVAEHDIERERAIEQHGYRVLRFQNTEVETDLPNVLNRIRAACSDR